MTLDLARWQFGITTVYHFLFVPITIGLSLLVAGLQTAWVRTGKERYLRLTKFWGKLLPDQLRDGRRHRHRAGVPVRHELVATTRRFVGDIFGAPLAIEGLLAFFLESTFLGLWIFGWDRLPPSGCTCACIWMAAIGTMLSAYFILAANSWMQHPVGYRRSTPTRSRAELTDIWAVLTNSTALVAFPHTITAAFLHGAAMFVLAVCAWHLRARQATPTCSARRCGSALVAVADRRASAWRVTGDLQAKLMTEQQPMKMAAAEALYDTDARRASFSLFTIGTLERLAARSGRIRVPDLLSFLATGTFDGTVEGINDLQAAVRGSSTGPATTPRSSRSPTGRSG